MTAIAEHLDRTLQILPAATAASVEKLVWDVISDVELQPQANASDERAEPRRPARVSGTLGKVDAMLDELDWSGFERPQQGESEVREDG